MVGRTTGGQQADHGVDDGALVDLLIERTVLAAGFGVANGLLGGVAGERFAHLGARVDERGTRQVQAHHFHHQLIGVGGAVEGAGAGAVVRVGLRLQQLLAAHLAFGVELANARFLLVRQAARHRACGYEHGGQVTKARRANE